MRISALSATTGVPVPTIKFYLRERLLPPGVPTGRNQAEYDDGHVRRLRLIRALREVGHLDLRAIRQVVAAAEDETVPLESVFGLAQRVLAGRPGLMDDGDRGDDARTRARQSVDRFLDELGWVTSPDAPARDSLARALAALWSLGRTHGADVFRPYADVAFALASQEVAAVTQQAEPRTVVVERVVVGTVIYEAVLLALRRLAHEHHARGRAASRVTALPAASS